MALETGTFISDLVASNPVGSDPIAFADDHLRLIKSTLKNTFPNVSGAVTKTHTQINNSVDKTGDTMTGPLTLSGPPSATLHAVTKAYVDALVASAVNTTKESLYPVGSIYVNASNGTNPTDLLGFGTWVEFGAGRVMVGQNAGDTAFDVLEETGGSKDAVVVSHTHTATADTAGEHAHTLGWRQFLDGSGATGGVGFAGEGSLVATTTAAGAHTHNVTVASAGSSGTNANLQPYVVVKMWKRTA